MINPACSRGELGGRSGNRGQHQAPAHQWGRGDGPGRIQSPARSVLAVQPPGSPVGGGRAGSTVSRRGCASCGQSGQKRSRQQCRAGRIQGQVIQSHRSANSNSSGWQERQPRSAWREPCPGRLPLLKEAFLLGLLRTREVDTSPRAGQRRATRRPTRARARGPSGVSGQRLHTVGEDADACVGVLFRASGEVGVEPGTTEFPPTPSRLPIENEEVVDIVVLGEGRAEVKASTGSDGEGGGLGEERAQCPRCKPGEWAHMVDTWEGAAGTAITAWPRLVSSLGRRLFHCN